MIDQIHRVKLDAFPNGDNDVIVVEGLEDGVFLSAPLDSTLSFAEARKLAEALLAAAKGKG